jgi:general secretion pathway protein E
MNVAEARGRAVTEGRALIDVLEESSGLAPEEFTRELAAAFDYPVARMTDLQAAAAAFDVVPFAEASARRAAALRTSDGRLFLAFADPFSAGLEDWAATRLGPRYSARLAHRADIDAWLGQQEQSMRAMDQIAGAEEAHAADSAEQLSLARISSDSSPVVKLVNSTLYDALKLQASDVHLESEADGLLIKYRIDGVLVQVAALRGAAMAEQVVSRVKVLAELDIAERRVPQDGRFRVAVTGREVDFRVSVMPSIFGEDAVLRVLDRRALAESAQALRLDHLGLDAGAIDAIRRMSARPHGMLLVTGPTGSGKTTTLYSAITEINSGRDKIITIEDPVEYRLPHILQIPVNEKKGLSFARGLRSILRHDPDKIMVGEIRDAETAQIAIQAALTGHLVFTTVHANSVFDVLGRFLHIGVDPYSFASALNCIVAQRLVRLVCAQCAARGCGHCRGTGYKGRKAVAEVLVLDDAMRELIAARAPVTQLKAEAARLGSRPLREAALALASAGETTLEEVDRVTF